MHSAFACYSWYYVGDLVRNLFNLSLSHDVRARGARGGSGAPNEKRIVFFCVNWPVVHGRRYYVSSSAVAVASVASPTSTFFTSPYFRRHPALSSSLNSTTTLYDIFGGAVIHHPHYLSSQSMVCTGHTTSGSTETDSDLPSPLFAFPRIVTLRGIWCSFVLWESIILSN